MSERRGGTPRTEEERKEEHKRKYGGGELPLRGTGLGLKGGKEKMGEEVVSDECSAALRAAFEVIGEKCKFTPPTPAKTIEIEGAGQLRIPVGEAAEAEKILEEKKELSKEEVFKVLKETWGKRVAAGTCSKYAGLVPGTQAYETCIESVSEKLARGMMA